MLEQVEDARVRTLKLFQFGGIMGVPMDKTRALAVSFMREAGLPIPSDVLAFATGGKASDAQVIDWNCPLGGHG